MKDVWKGVEDSEVEKIPMESFMGKIKSRNRRTLKRLNQNPRLKKLMERAEKAKGSKSAKMIKTHVREAIILPLWVGLTFGVHNGKEFKRVDITYDKVGRRLGDFSHTVGRVQHSGPGVGATRGSKFVPLK